MQSLIPTSAPAGLLQKQIDIVRENLLVRGIRSDKIESALYSIEMLGRAYMEDQGPTIDWKKYHLTKKEARICALLHKRLGKTVSRDALLDTLYHDDTSSEDDLEDPRKIIDVFICHAKKKLEDSPFSIDNDWGSGFRMTERVDWTPYGFTPSEALLAATLHSRIGTDISAENLISTLYPSDYKGRKGYERKTPRKTLHVMLHKIRLKLRSSAFHISHSQAAGYRMTYRLIPKPIATALNELAA